MVLSLDTLKVLKYLKSPEKKVDNAEWTVREKLALSSAVLETGQEYWPTISRMIQPFGSDRRTDKSWCSSKECAKQYSKILDNISTKKRNENNNSSLPLKELIVKKLTVERIEELQDDIRKEQEKQAAFKKVLKDLEFGALDDRIADMWDHFKENADFVDYVSEIERLTAIERAKAKEIESETTDAMTSSGMENESNSDDDQKPRLLLHLKKAVKRSRPMSPDSVNGKEHKSLKLDSYQDSDGSCDTDPAVYESDTKPEPIKIKVQKSVIESKSDNKIKVQDENVGNMASLAWVKRSKMIINIILGDPNSHILDSQLLSKSDAQYNNIIKKKINPTEIRNNLRDNHYSTPYEFEHDLLLCLVNAVIYFPIGSPSNKIARSIYDNIIPVLECLYESETINTSVNETVSRRSTRKSFLPNSII